ncbi:Uncharacterized protein AB751O23_BD_00050 [Chlamydiales bacterium SCGC AB-751-O23]|nr:Uncharacterized protein AB751O23_BD_00050 [Chlamydiales bacterium SCGC AB-751-O23]
MNKKTRKKALLTEGKESSVLIRMSIPMAIGILSLFFFNLADTYFVAKLGSKPLTALGFCLPLTLFLMNINLGIGTGATSIISKLIGEEKQELCLKRTIAASYLFLSVLCLAYVFTVLFFLKDIFYFLGAAEDTVVFIKAYLKPWLLGSILLTLLMLTSAILRATGDTKTPSMIMLCAGIGNACLNPLFIFGFYSIPAMGIKGAAYATVLSWGIAFIFALYLLQKKSGLLNFKSFKGATFFKDIKPVLKVGLPAALSNVLVPLSSSVLTWFLAKEGEVYVGAFGIANRLEPIALVVVIVLTASIVPFVGQNWGAGEIKRIQRGMLFSFKFVLIFEAVVALLMLISSPLICQVFTTDLPLRESLETYLYLVPISFGLQGVAMLVTSFLNAFQKPLLASLIIIIRLLLFQVPLAFIGIKYMGAPGVFLGKSIAGLLSGLVALLFYHFVIKEKLLEQNKSNQS